MILWHLIPSPSRLNKIIGQPVSVCREQDKLLGGEKFLCLVQSCEIVATADGRGGNRFLSSHISKDQFAKLSPEQPELHHLRRFLIYGQQQRAVVHRHGSEDKGPRFKSKLCTHHMIPKGRNPRELPMNVSLELFTG